MSEGRTFWAGAILSIVIVSWVFFRYLAPKSWREWAHSGIVGAFIIAFYADMYGFPVTIYVLTRLFKLDASGSFWDQNLWVYLTGTPAAMAVSMVLGYIFVFVGLTLLVAGWREIYNTLEQGRLATTGVYAFVRHPQYWPGSYIRQFR